MRKISLLALAPLIAAALCPLDAAAQIRIPDLPKFGRPKREQPKPPPPATGEARPTQATAAAPTARPEAKPTGPGSKRVYEKPYPTDTPVLVKDSIYIQANRHDRYWKLPNEKNYSSWVPTIRFNSYFDSSVEVSYVAEFLQPDGSLWFSVPLKQGVRGVGYAIWFESDPDTTREMLEAKSSAGVGTYGVRVTEKNRGEVVFQGKFKVGKFRNSSDPRDKNKFDFFVEHDWLLPIGYVGFEPAATYELGGNQIVVSLWMKGDIKVEDLEGRLFYQGRQIATTADTDGSSVVDEGERASESGHLSGGLHFWNLYTLQWSKFRHANGGSFNRGYYKGATYADENPGEYTVKVYRKGVEVREAKFQVGADGRLVDGRFAKPMHLINHKVMIPVKVVGGDEKWNALAWKTDAFYGNPPSGFSVP